MRSGAFGAIAVLVALAGGGCTSTAVTGGMASPQPSGGAATANPSPLAAGISVVAGGGRCSYRQEGGYVLPDPGCTPGATNPAVTPATVRRTICSRGWTSTVRPPESYTEPLRREQMDSYNAVGSTSGYEEDHLIPLELGGSPADPKNLWPEPGTSPNPKDDVEYAANRAVCSGEMPLAVAQREIAQDWVVLGRSLGILQGTN